MPDDPAGPVSTPTLGYALPYYTRDLADTEYLISNPNRATVTGSLSVYDQKCQIAQQVPIKIDPNCTTSIRLRAIVSGNAGHAILEVSDLVIAHLLYFWDSKPVLTAGELAGTDQLLQTKGMSLARTYGVGYRTLSLGSDHLSGAIFVSNPAASLLTGTIVFFHEECDVADKQKVKIYPGCTQEFAFPADRYGFARLQLSAQAVVNVLHFSSSTPGIAAAELAGESHRVHAPPIVSRGRGILFDATHDCVPTWFGGAGPFWGDFEAMLVAAGFLVTELTNQPVTDAALQGYDVYVVAAAGKPYSTAELAAIANFADSGGGVLVLQEHHWPGQLPPWIMVMRDVLSMFGTIDDGNMVIDTMHNLGGPAAVVYEAQRNFSQHPIVSGLKGISTDANCTFSPFPLWTTIIETDGGAVPPRRPVLIGREFGAGRVLAFSCANTWAETLPASGLGILDNKLFGQRCIEWLLRRI